MTLLAFLAGRIIHSKVLSSYGKSEKSFAVSLSAVQLPVKQAMVSWPESAIPLIAALDMYGPFALHTVSLVIFDLLLCPVVGLFGSAAACLMTSTIEDRRSIREKWLKQDCNRNSNLRLLTPEQAFQGQNVGKTREQNKCQAHGAAENPCRIWWVEREGDADESIGLAWR